MQMWFRSLMVLLAISVGTAAWAGAKEEAERYRLEMEMEKLASKNAWVGVERTYEAMMKLGIPLKVSAHYTAAQGAQSRGEMLLAQERLRRAVGSQVVRESDDAVVKASLPAEIDPADPMYQDSSSTLETIKTRYGRVSVKIDSSRISALVRMPPKPFSNLERSAIQFGQEALADKRQWEGLLPVGRYMIDGDFFEVKAGETAEVEIAGR